MRARTDEGAALVMIIGVVAALAVMASALVLLTVNAAGNTGRDRARAQAFNVAEGLIDYTLARLGSSWPSTGATAIDTTAFVGQFAAATTAGKFTISDPSVTFFDNVDTNGVGGINRADGVPYDKNTDGLLWVEAQASVNGQKVRIQAEASEVMLDTKIPRGYIGGGNYDIDNANHNQNSGSYALGCDAAYGGYMDPLLTTQLNLMAGGSHIDDGSTYDPLKFGPDLNGDGVPDGVRTGVTGAAQILVTPAILQSIIRSAKMTGTWYSNIASEQLAGAKPIPAKNDTAKWQGIVVVETTGSVDFENNDVINRDGVGGNEKPGFLVIIGPETMYPDDSAMTGKSVGLKIAGSGTYYGVVYSDGDVDFVGTMSVIGMVVADGYIYLNGARCVQYNDNVITNLNQSVPVMAQVVPDTWRQIQPL